MKKTLVLVVVGLFLLPLVSWAGEKEDLELQGKYLLEKEKRLQMELGLFNREKQEFDARVRVYAEQERAKQPVKPAEKPNAKPVPEKPQPGKP